MSKYPIHIMPYFKNCLDLGELRANEMPMNTRSFNDRTAQTPGLNQCVLSSGVSYQLPA